MILDLWYDIKTKGDPAVLGSREQDDRLRQILTARSRPGLRDLSIRCANHIDRTRTLTALTVCHALEQATALLLLHLILRRGVRNQLDTGIQQSYGDHTRMLALGIDRMKAADNKWLASRVWKSTVSPAEVSACIEAFRELNLDPQHELALWIAASLHDYGKLYGRRNGLDPEDGVELVGSIFADLEPIVSLVPLMLFVIRNHDVIESVTTGCCPVSYVRDQLQELPSGQQGLASAFLGVVQLAGAASLGMGRIVPSKIGIYRSCLSRRITERTTPEDRLRLLCARAELGDDNFVTIVGNDRNVGVSTRTRDFVDRVVIHGWNPVRIGVWSARQDDAYVRLHALIDNLADLVSVCDPPVQHLTLDPSAAAIIVDRVSAGHPDPLVGLGRRQATALNGAPYLSIFYEPQTTYS